MPERNISGSGSPLGKPLSAPRSPRFRTSTSTYMNSIILSSLRSFRVKITSAHIYCSARPSLIPAAQFRRTMATVSPPRDPCTLSNYNYFRTSHTVTNLTISFKNQQLVGNVTLTLESLTDAQTKEIVLDSSYLDISSVKIDGKNPKWELLPRTGPLGNPLKIQLDNGIKKGESIDVDVRFPHKWRDYESEMADEWSQLVHRYQSRLRRNVRLCNGSHRRRLVIRSILICVRVILGL